MALPHLHFRKLFWGVCGQWLWKQVQGLGDVKRESGEEEPGGN